MMTATCSSQNDPSIDGMMIFHFISRWFLPISWLPSVTSTAHPWKSLKINDWKMIFPVGAGLFSEAMSGRVTMLPSQLRWASFSGRCPFYDCGKLDVFVASKKLSVDIDLWNLQIFDIQPWSEANHRRIERIPLVSEMLPLRSQSLRQGLLCW